MLIDRRNKKKGFFSVRMFSFTEIEKLFNLPIGYTKILNKTKRRDVLGNSVIVNVISFVLDNIKIYCNVIASETRAELSSAI